LNEKILIIGPAWVGDMVMAQSLFMTLRRLQPECVIDVLAPAWTSPLIERMPEVRRAVAAPFDHGKFDLGGRLRLGRDLAREKYDRAIVLPNSWKSALVPFFAGIPRRTGWRGEMRYGLLNDVRTLDKPRFPLMIDRFNALAFDKDRIGNASDFPATHPAPRLSVTEDSVAAARVKFDITDQAPVLALCPGAEFGPSKRWPEDKFAEVAAHKLAAGWQVWLFGSAKDLPVCEAIRAKLPPLAQARCTILAGRTSLAEAVDLLSCADAVVSNDSGLMHVAAALGRPLVAVYGSTSPSFTPPLTERKRIVRLGLDCSPCFKRECPLGHHDCMKKLPPAMVLDALVELESAA
jgi:heptosyltransferase-2